MDLSSIDLTNLDLFESGDAERAFAVLRAQAPVHWHRVGNGPGFWVLTHYDHVVRTWKQAGLYSSEHGIMLRLRDRRDPASGKMMVVTDPPRHTRLRGVLNRAFSPRMTARLASGVERLVDELLDALRPDQVHDFAVEVAAPLSTSVNLQLVGVPHEDWRSIARLTVTSFAAEDPEYRSDASLQASSTTANFRLLAYLLGLVAKRRAAPTDDLISVLLTATVEGEPLSDEEIALNCVNLLIGGNETTRYAATGGMLAFVEHPAELRRLRDRPDLMDAAVEEVLRWTTPNAHVLRVVTAPTTIAGRCLDAGDLVTLWTASANRDERRFPDADRFDIARRPNPHVTFGVGPHHCLGASLARTELRSLFGAIARRGLDFELAGEAPRLRSNFLAGRKHLPLRFRSGLSVHLPGPAEHRPDRRSP